MCTKVLAFPLAALFVSAAAGQPTDRVFHLTEARTMQDVQEVVTVMRSVGGIRPVSVNADEKSVAVRGTPDEVRLAEWIVAALDRPATVPQEFAIPGSADERLRAFHLTHAQTSRDLQEMATLIRSIADAQYVSVCSAPKVLILRGNTWRVSLAEWLIGELNQPTGTPPPAGPREYRLQSGNDILPPEDVFVRVFYTSARTPEQLAGIATDLRSIVKMLPRTFVNSARRAIIVRASAGSIKAAEQALSGEAGNQSRRPGV